MMSRGDRGRWLFLALTGLAAVATVVLLPLLSTLHASAQPVAGAYYSGSVAGAGDIEFDVSPAGDEVQNLRITQIPCDGGTHDAFTWPFPIAIVGGRFDATFEPLATRVTGQFPTESSAEGTFLLDLGDCQSPELTWTATTSDTPTATATPSPTATATPSPTPTATPTPPDTPSPTATPTPAPSATPTPQDLLAGWNHVCYLGARQDIQDALAGISQNVLAVYSLVPNQGYDKWFPGRPEISTISTLSPYQSLLLLLTSDTSWPQQPSSPKPADAPLQQSWNSICYAGETDDVPAATQSIEGRFSVLYTLGSDQVWQRFVPGRPGISDLAQLTRFTSVLILVTQEGGTQWSFGP